jgi:hypothetical protein
MKFGSTRRLAALRQPRVGRKENHGEPGWDRTNDHLIKSLTFSSFLVFPQRDRFQ